MQALTGKIDRDCRLILIYIHVDSYARALKINRRTHAKALVKLIDDRVLDLQRAELRVRDRPARSAEIHRQGA